MNLEKKFYLTQKGLKEIEKEYEVLKVARAAKTKEDAPTVLESEDLNPEYVSFQEDLDLLETKIAELEVVMSNVEIIKAPLKKDRDLVRVGAKIAVEINNKEKDAFEIVGTIEADPSLGKISNESPVGSALLGHRVGDEVCVSSPDKTIYRIKKVNYS